jgi:multidrug efflux system membrane fusion protein
VLFSLPQDQLPQVIARMRTGAPMITEAYDRDNSDKIATGKLLTIDNQIDTTTGTYKLKAVFDNAKGELFPNQFVNMHLLVDTEKNVVIVPTTAVLRGPKGAYVFAVSQDNTVKMHDVTLTHATGDVTGISSGLASGEVVVVDGQDKLQDGSKVEPRTSRVGGAAAQSSTSSNDPPAASPAGRPAR